MSTFRHANGQLTAVNVSVAALVNFAMGISSLSIDPRILGLPEWANERAFNVTAKASPGTPNAALPPMVRSMLTDRFGMKVHSETRQIAAYTLALGPDGAKMTANADCAVPASAAISTTGPSCGFISEKSGDHYVVTGHGVTTGDLVNWALSLASGFPIVDRTGLAGHYDFTLTCDLQSYTGATAADYEDIHQTNRRTIERAMRDQLGLTLDLAHTEKQPVQVWVIDHISKPAPN